MKLQNIPKHIIDSMKITIGFIVASIMKIDKRNNDIWLIAERKDEAEDNGYHLFKYINENKKNQKVVYIIDKKSKGYMRIKDFEEIVQYNSLKHYIYFFLCNKHISPFQFFGVPDTPIIWKLDEMGYINKKRIFLQHGVTQSKLPFLFYKNTKYDLFICSSKDEYEYIKNNFGYPDKNIKCLGQCRYDNLYDYTIKRQILVMPTWRQWFGMTQAFNEGELTHKKFLNSQYYYSYSSLLNNKKLQKILADNNMQLIFYPHPEMQRFIKDFKSNNYNIKIANRSTCNLQELLKESEILITDYSSIAFDFAYMRKKLIYYQFDKEEYYTKHFKKGYFDCERDGFGPVVINEDELIYNLKNMIENKFNQDIYIQRSKKFFTVKDKNNCKRTYDAILNID